MEFQDGAVHRLPADGEAITETTLGRNFIPAWDITISNPTIEGYARIRTKALGAARAFADKAQRVLADKRLSPEAKGADVSTLKTEGLAALEALETEITDIAGSRETRVNRLLGLGPATDVLAELQRQEIRRYVNELPTSDKMAFLLKTDLQTLRAVVSSPTYLTGLSAQARDLAMDRLVKETDAGREIGAETEAERIASVTVRSASRYISQFGGQQFMQRPA